MGLAAIVAGLVLQDAQPWWLAMAAGLATGFAAGAVNGVLIAWLGLPPFVVTLGTLSIGRSLAVVLSQNKMIYDFGPDADTIFAIGGGQYSVSPTPCGCCSHSPWCSRRCCT